MSIETQIAILMEARSTRREAERYLKNGSIIFEAQEFEENFDKYMKEWCAGPEEIAAYKRMIDKGIEAFDWSIAHYEGKKYYIMYVC